ncbi:MAG TPA: Smr/MutS family protein [Geobacteraceae bacterium]
MKKKKQTDKKTKDFAVHPFTSLKGFQTDAEAAGKKKPAPASPPPPRDDDALVFLRAVADVKRLHPQEVAAKEKKRGAPAGKGLAEAERQAFLKEVERLQLDVKFRDELPEDVTPLRPAATNRLRDLKRGAIRIGLELDLHGLTREEALANLARFISGAYNRGQKAVLVITGKGNNSPEEPVLQGAVSGWLRDRGKGMVAEFAPAPRQMGGSGAFVVFLKERKTGE